MTREIPKAGEFYLHFKGNLYQIVTIAKHTETQEDLVIYQALYGDYRIYARPLPMFMSEVDREKYPQSDQKYRFERTILKEAGIESPLMRQPQKEPVQNKTETLAEESSEIQDMEILFRFLDAKDLEERQNLLMQYRDQWTDSMLDSMGIAMDCILNGQSREEKYYELDKVIRTKLQYEKKPR